MDRLFLPVDAPTFLTPPLLPSPPMSPLCGEPAYGLGIGGQGS